eukprot:1161603-Pelagomonas_calceolata.AAC.5
MEKERRAQEMSECKSGTGIARCARWSTTAFISYDDGKGKESPRDVRVQESPRDVRVQVRNRHRTLCHRAEVEAGKKEACHVSSATSVGPVVSWTGSEKSDSSQRDQQ